MSFARALRRAAPVLVVAAGLALGTAAAAQPVLNALTPLLPGEWQLTAEGEGPRRICVVNPEALFQIRHRVSACSRLVIADGRNIATVHYSCPGAGWGRTTLRVSTPEVVHISTQGIADNAPFDFELVARRTGACADRTASR